MKYKKLALDILGILVISSLMGLAYNFYSSKSLPLIKQEVQVKTIGENELFGAGNNLNSTQTVSSNLTQAITNKDSSAVLAKTDNPKELTSETAQIEKPTIKNIGIDLVKKYINDRRITLIDARSPEVFSEGKIANAINIYPSGDDKESYFNSINNLSKDKIILIYCDGGDCDLSHHLANDLLNFGFQKIFIFVGGWEEWSKKMVNNG